MASFSVKLNEKEARTALAAWVRQTHGLDVTEKDVSFTISSDSPDPRDRGSPHVASVTITAAEPPRRAESAPRQWQGDLPVEPR